MKVIKPLLILMLFYQSCSKEMKLESDHMNNSIRESNNTIIDKARNSKEYKADHSIDSTNKNPKYLIWLKTKRLVGDNLLLDDKNSNLFLCGQYFAYGTDEFKDFKPRIENCIIELKYLVDTLTFEMIHHPYYRDKNYFYSYKSTYEGGTISVFKVDKVSKSHFNKLLDSLNTK